MLFHEIKSKMASVHCSLQESKIKIWSGYENPHLNFHATNPLTRRHKTLTLNRERIVPNLILERRRIKEFLGRRQLRGNGKIIETLLKLKEPMRKSRMRKLRKNPTIKKRRNLEIDAQNLSLELKRSKIIILI